MSSKQRIMGEFNILVDEIQFKGIYERALKAGSQKYFLKPYMIADLDPTKARLLYEKIIDKFYKGNNIQQSQTWYENQLRLFIWVLVCYIFLRQCELQKLTINDWRYLSKIFPQKDPNLFDYQCRSLFKTHFNLKDNPWDHEEIEILTLIVKGKGSKIKWNQVSKQLYFASNRLYYRTPKQCRERWFNHEDPGKRKGDWTTEQCLKMFNYVLKNGKKWAGLVKELGGSRNEHAIKNKFNSLVKRQKKQEAYSTDEEIYQQIIHRISNTMQSGQFQTRFQFQTTKKGFQKRGEEREESKSYFTKNFMQKLLNFNVRKSKQSEIQEKESPLKEEEKQEMEEVDEQNSENNSLLFEDSEDNLNLEEYNFQQNFLQDI